MESNGFFNLFYNITHWITRFAYVNVLWILFTLAGIIIIGFFPATVSMFAVVRKWILGETDLPIFKTFWKYYKIEFLKSNTIGYIILLIGFIFYVDLRMLYLSEGFIQILYYPILVITFIYLLLCLNIFPIYVHYELKVLQVIKGSLKNIVINPLSTIVMIIASIISYAIFSNFPGLIPFFSGSILAYVLFWSFFLSVNNKTT